MYTPETIFNILKEDGLRLKEFECVCDNEMYVMEAVKQNGLALQFASERLRAEKEVVLEAIRQNILAAHFALIETKEEKQKNVVEEENRKNEVLLTLVVSKYHTLLSNFIEKNEELIRENERLKKNEEQHQKTLQNLRHEFQKEMNKTERRVDELEATINTYDVLFSLSEDEEPEEEITDFFEEEYTSEEDTAKPKRKVGRPKGKSAYGFFLDDNLAHYLSLVNKKKTILVGSLKGRAPRSRIPTKKASSYQKEKCARKMIKKRWDRASPELRKMYRERAEKNRCN